MMKILKSVLVVLFVVVAGYLVVDYYPYIFAKDVKGTLTAVERLMNPQVAVIQGGTNGELSQQIFSFAIGVKDEKTGEIFTASSEDRRWAAAQKDQCAEVRFFPYPPWRIDKSGTFFNARLVKLFDCPAKN